MLRSPPAAAIGLDDSCREEGGLRRQHSSSSLQSVGSCGFSAGVVMNASRVHTMRRSINEHVNAVSKLLLTSKDSSERRCQIESALRSCKEAFFELSTIYLCLLEEKKNDQRSMDSIKSMISQALTQFGAQSQREDLAGTNSCSPRSYAEVACSSAPAVRIAKGTSIAVKNSTNLLILPKKDTQDKYTTSKDTMETFQKIIKPADYNLKVCGIRNARGNGIRLEALTGDLDKIKKSRELDRAGLEVEQVTKLKPRLILHNVPVGMTKDEIKTDLIALNLDMQTDTVSDINIIYTFPPKDKKTSVSCVIEVSPAIRTKLLKNSRVYINYSTCRLEDYIRVLQCYKCLAFGHLSKHCTAESLCGHCAGTHEMKNCPNRSSTAICGNCKRWLHEELSHSALDGRSCSILKKRLQEKIRNINYG